MSPKHKRTILPWAGNPLVMVPPGLCLLLLFPSLTGSSDVQVTQTPRHLVKGKGQRARMDCIPPKEHPVVYWYQQTQNKEFKFLISFQNENVLDQIELVKERFLAQCPKNVGCSLEIQASEPGDSALYFCASSFHSTEISAPLIAQTHPGPSSGSR